jgi:murein DD-endopeptidase MepM/ murein hydrolase activator NlpD
VIPVFRERQRGLLEFAVAVVLIWVAADQTPLGALIRHAAGLVTGRPSSARSLLAYYSDGVYESVAVAATTTPAPPPPPSALLSPEGALAYGNWAVWARLADGEQRSGLELASRYGVEAIRLTAPASGPLAMAQLLSAGARELGSTDAAVLATFVGYPPVHYAAERARAEHTPLVLEELVRQLPPEYRPACGHAAQALMLGTAYALAWPVSALAPISSGFGPRLHPILGVRKLHTGVDIAVPVGTPVEVVAPGTVRRVSEDGVNGRMVVVDHGHGVTTAYCHNTELLVQLGQVVQRGDRVARSGNTGRSSGPHLHFQLELADRPVDPLVFRPNRVPFVAASSAELANDL